MNNNNNNNNSLHLYIAFLGTQSALHRMHEYLTLYVLLHFVVYDERIRIRAEFSQWRKNLSERLLLAIAFINSTDSCVIGYNLLQLRCKNVLSRSKLNAAVNTFHFQFICDGWNEFRLTVLQHLCPWFVIVSTSGNCGYADITSLIGLGVTYYK